MNDNRAERYELDDLITETAINGKAKISVMRDIWISESKYNLRSLYRALADMVNEGQLTLVGANEVTRGEAKPSGLVITPEILDSAEAELSAGCAGGSLTLSQAAEYLAPRLGCTKSEGAVVLNYLANQRRVLVDNRRVSMRTRHA